MKEYIVDRITRSSIVIKANSLKEAEDIACDIDGDHDDWDYYKEEIDVFKYNEYSQTHTINRDDEEASNE
tara:strand:- start:100 stop:309 length:210 start_codon:yes stop_codon:yes gene_type:complete